MLLFFKSFRFNDIVLCNYVLYDHGPQQNIYIQNKI